MYVFTMPAERFDEENPNKQDILHLITKHQAFVPRLQKLKDYYEGHHGILEDKERDNKLVCNHAKDIADTASAYFLGNPISYKSDDKDLSVITDALETAGADEADGDNALDLSIYGLAYDYIYAHRDATDLVIKNLEPENSFVVYDDTIEQNELFGVYYYIRKDDTARTSTPHYIATILTKNYKWVLDIEKIDQPQALIEGPVEHHLGEIPMIEWKNNKLGIGDYELQIPLIDAYNALMSDRITDKEQFIDAILAVYGTLLTDEDDEEEGDGKGAEKAMKRLAKRKLLEMPDSTKAEYLTRTFDESGVEILRHAIEQDIHKFSHIPCLTDEHFSGNTSGVAMEFKLLGIENITKIKTRYYRKGLRKRLRIFANWLALNRQAQIDSSTITANFTRALPKNLLEISQYVNNLKGTVSRKTLLSQIPFVDDPDAEIKAVKEETEEAIRQQQELFKEPGAGNEPPEPNNEDPETSRPREGLKADEEDELEDESE